MTLLLVLICASVDFGRALNDLQTMADLTRQGSNLASRGTSLPEAAAAVISGQSGLDLANNGVVIITSVVNNSNVFTISGQASQGRLSQTSKIGTGVGTNVTRTLPVAAQNSLQNGQTIFVTEIFYGYTPDHSDSKSHEKRHQLAVNVVQLRILLNPRTRSISWIREKLTEASMAKSWCCFRSSYRYSSYSSVSAIDLGLAYVTKTTLSKSVDAAALAAMRNLNQGQSVAATGRNQCVHGQLSNNTGPRYCSDTRR